MRPFVSVSVYVDSDTGRGLNNPANLITVWLSCAILMVWFGILVAVNLQTAWLSPPVALSAYFLKGVVPEWDLKDIYLGMMQFMLVQLVGLILIFIFPQLVLWLPKVMTG